MDARQRELDRRKTEPDKRAEKVGADEKRLAEDRVHSKKRPWQTESESCLRKRSPLR